MFALEQGSNPKGCAIPKGIVCGVRLLFKTDITVCLWGNLSSAAIFTCTKESALHLLLNAPTHVNTRPPVMRTLIKKLALQTKSVSPRVIGVLKSSTKA